MTYSVLIVGAGGWGREVLEQMQGDIAHRKEWEVTGFLDSREHILDGFDTGVPIVGDPLTYVPRGNEAFVCAQGDPLERHKYIQPLLAKGAAFIPICTEAHLSRRVHLGTGCFLGNQVHVGPDVWIGDFANLLTWSVIGHDVRIGNYAHVGAQVFMGGGVQIGDFAVVHPRATLVPGVKVGEHAVVGTGAVVLKDVPAGATVFGNPAKIVFHKNIKMD
ncbi:MULTISPECIES: NeuD/PglB/VioB family sugar acetyltransferase [Xanthomonas]|uniref:Sugar O-acyltransferase (Sialic acid O-acetyltransferase NeuD family) n=1 Tax=Xanthomonas arboricola TaxID=56448 RepID=A0AB73H391_9XANT|nr:MULTISPECIES: NeuD/PglB/VioB family sugar acetyltransferase [Xanthomonas]MBB3761449.1 sugar O-acyltransferase (sialic acid O-acetyltransferase NeuD family) [Xanthomonas arboricola]MBB3799524.1 sugar O-acyltransferase (sialic acid O-acetyltransferase NeuD family) [Xanthomonas arboricola]MBB4597207.1 sugar O-acyltransferase (sialic acid O-acetyltransferase NeuD family) [Xanthomonas arboricola]MBB4729571.1 sugar O-acyltransferase (sialic acid O-acetyltransferase NeuD family) [Xanthomonas arbori